MVRVENLSVSYGSKQVLDHLSFEVKPGEVHGIVGENGAGKTTLFESLVGFKKGYSGSVDYVPDVQQSIGFLPANPPMITKITGSEYLKLVLLARGIDRDDFDGSNIFDLPLNSYADTYSTGMQKKLALLGVILQGNAFYVLDEPFNGLDYQSCLLVIDILAELRTAGKAVIVSSHIFSTLSDSCDYIHFLKRGAFQHSVGKEKFSEIEAVIKRELIRDSVKGLGIR
ncbi:ABC transporter ATP-binding protein [Reichenbachiella sp. MSK19-1]|uniref:ATP-binding cassette domain-containing protein n=1 Tax=Reichenbachiella sp. MSK19-1 TaxID=1897631 RepID=UPI000E6C26D6|nr:ABC transporter ATP-binding protein [Reichenbachiella sp. MSK19-1]RJE70422.1 ABC transporter ATP-binding protein [Reichenbachiella sp. MSK19-1]